VNKHMLLQNMLICC